MPRLPPRFLYRLFPLAGRTSAWIEQRFPSTGRLVLGLLVAGALFGVDIRQTLGYQIAALMLALLVTALVASLAWRPALRVTRVLPEHATATLPLDYWIEITNHGTRVERDLLVQDRLPQPPVPYETFLAARDLPGARATNVFDRAIGFPRWVEMRRLARGADTDALPVPAIAPGATVRVRATLTPRRRGRIRFEALEVLRPDPLGLFRARRRFAAAATLLALPRRYAVPRIGLRSERRYQPGGVSLALAVGDSQEFAALRDYRPGDPRRHIHWRSFAKTGKLVVREYLDEYFDRHALVVDTHLQNAPPELFEAVVSVAASIAAGERPRDSILDLIFAGEEVVQLSAGRGLGDALHALAWLADARPCADTHFERLVELLRERAGELASVILVLGRFDAPRRALVDELALRGLPSVCLLLSLEEDAAAPPSAIGAHRTFVVRAGAIAEDLARIGTVT